MAMSFFHFTLEIGISSLEDLFLVLENTCAFESLALSILS